MQVQPTTKSEMFFRSSGGCEKHNSKLAARPSSASRYKVNSASQSNNLNVRWVDIVARSTTGPRRAANNASWLLQPLHHSLDRQDAPLGLAKLWRIVRLTL